MPGFKDGTSIDSKGYLKITAGPLRGVRVHRLVAAAKLGRPLTRDEDVHHIDEDKLNVSPDNLKILGHREHGAVSTLQHWYLKEHGIKLESEWNAFFKAEAQ
jgi:hypothetical protein